jgi:RNA polymerase primary sigma factor
MEEQLAGKDHNEETLALRLGITIEKARMIRNLIHGIRSEDPLLSAEALQKLTVEHGREPSADLEEFITFQIENERIRSLIERCLSKREQEILRIRYGLDDGKHKTLAETGKIMGVSRERIRQIEKRALKKLKIMMVSPREK